MDSSRTPELPPDHSRRLKPDTQRKSSEWDFANSRASHLRSICSTSYTKRTKLNAAADQHGYTIFVGKRAEANHHDGFRGSDLQQVL